MQTQQAFAEVNGTRLYYEVAGSGHPLVLLHGFSLDTAMWDDQFEAFAQHYRVIRYDMRGFGKSAVPSGEPYSHASDLKALLTHLGMSRPYLVGLSLGAATALNFVLAYPGMTDALVLADAVLPGFEWSPPANENDGLVWAVGRTDGIHRAKELWLQHSLFAPVREKPEVAARFAQIVSDYSGWHWVNDDPGDYPDPPAIKLLDKINIPTLALAGSHDQPDHLNITDILARQIPGAQKIMLSGVGHMSNMEDPATFNQVALTFLAGIQT